MPVWHPAYVLRRPGEVKSLIRDVSLALHGPEKTKYEVLYSPPEVTEITTPNQLNDIINEVQEGTDASYDLETNQVVWYDRPKRPANMILLMAFCFPGEHRGYVINDALLYDEPMIPALLDQMFFPKFSTVGHNAMFDNIFLRSHLNIRNARVDFDTIVAKYAVDELPPHGLKPIAHHYFGLHDYEAELVQKHLRSRSDEYSKVPYRDLATYGVWDVRTTLEFKYFFEKKLKQEGMLEWPFYNILMPGQELMSRMEMRGIKVDMEQLREVQQTFQTEMDDLRGQMQEMCQRPEYNPNSAPQTSEVLWDQLKLAPNKRTRIYRQRPRSTGKEAVEHLSSYNPKTWDKVREGHPFVDLLVHYRRVMKMQTSYVKNLIKFADMHDRVHPSGKVYGTEVGRLSFSDPAIQTIPRPGDKYGAYVRSAFIPSDGNVLVIVDVSQAELRVFAAESGAEFLLDAYNNDRDIHSEVAVVFYGANFTKEHRVNSKMFNFAYVYGGTKYSYARDAGMPLSEAAKMVLRFDNAIPEGKAYRQDQFAKMLEDGYVQSRFGRKRRVELITRSNADDVRKASVHAIIAGSAHDITLLSAIRLDKEGYPVVLEVHDSIGLDVPEEDALDAAEYVSQVMLETAEHWYPEVQWKVDPEIKTRWSEPPRS
jgi:DNA polymerase-1